ncbi:divalent-cation tolerance protein CutA [Oculatella sp. LEGE 06141]|uniref:divalent-cation tolerance protein CutA n=1 Tax=Oculatella sp. LEGE 06141 TaxID=1828648 RepID=UPI00187E3DF4|nr:divalent-cation tolerance protein CutA [Oculatella sp. LEGE 06141]MBE9177095.1 divalent-cation tolerance protein CutA [Oculatella sp. LEGE 06141]
MQQSHQYGVVLITAASREEAEAIANTLIAEQLAACVSMMPIHSIYQWQGETHHAEEWQLIVKTDLAKFLILEAKVRELHSYDVPEILALPVLAGSQPYLHWLSNQMGE